MWAMEWRHLPAEEDAEPARWCSTAQKEDEWVMEVGGYCKVTAVSWLVSPEMT